MARISIAKFIDLDRFTLHDILRLRTDVFVVEQECPYSELDGRDTEAGTRHVWAEVDGEVASYLRVTEESGAHRIGRVCTAQAARGQGLARRLITIALDHLGDTAVWMNAQVQVAPLYQAHGFIISGEQFLEDGIPHVLMTRSAPTSAEQRT